MQFFNLNVINQNSPLHDEIVHSCLEHLNDIKLVLKQFAESHFYQSISDDSNAFKFFPGTDVKLAHWRCQILRSFDCNATISGKEI